jgi:CBS-domain-containing membrane protein
MTSPVVTVKPYFTVQHAAMLFMQHGISAAPVIDDDEHLIGIISEGDLLHRAEIHTERPFSWWLAWFASDQSLAETFIKERSRKVADLMTKDVVTVSPDTALNEIALLLEKNRIKRLPVVEKGRLVGVVSRANLIQALASSPLRLNAQPSDADLRNKILAELNNEPWSHPNLINVTVNDGVVDLWGTADSDTERKAIRLLAEGVQGVRAVNDHLHGRYIAPI